KLVRFVGAQFFSEILGIDAPALGEGRSGYEVVQHRLICPLTRKPRLDMMARSCFMESKRRQSPCRPVEHRANVEIVSGRPRPIQGGRLVVGAGRRVLGSLRRLADRDRTLWPVLEDSRQEWLDPFDL